MEQGWSSTCHVGYLVGQGVDLKLRGSNLRVKLGVYLVDAPTLTAVISRESLSWRCVQRAHLESQSACLPEHRRPTSRTRDRRTVRYGSAKPTSPNDAQGRA